MSPPGLIADVGGTRVRFALTTGGARFERVAVVDAASFDGFESAARAYLGGQEIAAAAVCAAGPVAGGEVTLTNSGWRITTGAISTLARGGPALLVNDFEAVAHALPVLGATDRRLLTANDIDPTRPMAVLGPGTGLGVAGWLPDGPAVIAGEGGHATLAVSSAREWAIVEVLAARFGHVSAERVLSGAGLSALLDAIDVLAGDSPRQMIPAAVADAAFGNSDRRAVEAVARFTDWLGVVAGNVALTFGARGGVFIAGGIVPGWGEHFDEPRFLQRFRGKGRFEGWMREVPVAVITQAEPGLAGLARLLAESTGP